MAYPAYDYTTPDDYLAFEIKAKARHEYFDGRIYAMAAASYDHNYIVSNLNGEIRQFLKGKKCDIFVADQRVVAPNFDSFMYPDITIVCGPIESIENGFDTLTNPSAIIEVLSPSTRGYDMAFKSHYYKQIPSLKEYIVVDSTKFFILVNRKQNDEWMASETEDINSSLSIETIDMQLPLKEIYSKVSFAVKCESPASK